MPRWTGDIWTLTPPPLGASTWWNWDTSDTRDSRYCEDFRGVLTNKPAGAGSRASNYEIEVGPARQIVAWDSGIYSADRFALYASEVKWAEAQGAIPLVVNGIVRTGAGQLTSTVATFNWTITNNLPLTDNGFLVQISGRLATRWEVLLGVSVAAGNAPVRLSLRALIDRSSCCASSVAVQPGVGVVIV